MEPSAKGSLGKTGTKKCVFAEHAKPSSATTEKNNPGTVGSKTIHFDKWNKNEICQKCGQEFVGIEEEDECYKLYIKKIK